MFCIIIWYKIWCSTCVHNLYWNKYISYRAALVVMFMSWWYFVYILAVGHKDQWQKVDIVTLYCTNCTAKVPWNTELWKWAELLRESFNRYIKGLLSIMIVIESCYIQHYLNSTLLLLVLFINFIIVVFVCVFVGSVKVCNVWCLALLVKVLVYAVDMCVCVYVYMYVYVSVGMFGYLEGWIEIQIGIMFYSSNQCTLKFS